MRQGMGIQVPCDVYSTDDVFIGCRGSDPMRVMKVVRDGKTVWEVEEKLKLCPFCGGIAELIETRGHYGVTCDGYCCAGYSQEAMWKITKQEAIKAWNKRA